MPSDLHGHPGEGVDDDVLEGRSAPAAGGRALPVFDDHGRLVGWSHRSAPAAGRALPPATAAGSPVTDRPAGTVGAAASDLSAVQVAAAVAAVAGADPGPALEAWVDSVDVSVLPVAVAVEVVAAAARLEAAARARTAALAAELSRREEMDPSWSRLAGAPPAQRSVAGDELAMRMGISRVAANQLVRQGLAFAGQLQATGDALACGHLDAAKAAVLVRRLGDLPWQVAVAVEDRVLPGADRRTPVGLRADVEQALTEVDPGEAATRHEHARRTRRVTRPRVEDDGMASMWLVLAAEDAVRVDGVLDAVARTARACGDPRTCDQIRADGLRDLVVGEVDDVAEGRDVARGSLPTTEVSHHDYLTLQGLRGITLFRPVTPDDPIFTGDGAGGAGTSLDRVARTAPVTTTGTHGTCACGCGASTAPRGRNGTRIDVTVAASTLAGLDDQPAHLHGYGPIDADTARALAADATWRRILTDAASGAVLDVGRTRYRPPAVLAEHIRVRDRHCAAPGCTVPARRCDIDHTIEYHARPDARPHDPADGSSGEPTVRRSHAPARGAPGASVLGAPDAPTAGVRDDRGDGSAGDGTADGTGDGGRRTVGARGRDGRGTTSADNLGPLCPRHHRLKTDGGFRLRQVAPGLFEWVTPGGHRYRTRPGTDEVTDLTAIAVWTGADTGDPIPF